MTIAPLHPTHDTEPTPLFVEAFYGYLNRRHNVRPNAEIPRLRLLPGGSDPIPRCRPTARRLAILNDGTGVTGAVLWSV